MNAQRAVRSIETIERSIEAMESGDPERFQRLSNELVHPDCEWTPLIAEGVEGTYRGRDGIAKFFQDLLGSFDVRYEDRELRPIGDNAVLLLCRLKLKGRESGLDVDQEMGSVFEFEDGQLRRGHAYPTHAEALAAAEALRA